VDELCRWWKRTYPWEKINSKIDHS
jgi:hypothetical protein